MAIRAFVLLLLLGCVAPPALGNETDEWKAVRAVTDRVQPLEKGEPDKAIAEYTRFLQANPKLGSRPTATVIGRMVVIHATHRKDTKVALELADWAVEKYRDEPAVATCLQAKADVLLGLKRYDDVVALIDTSWAQVCAAPNLTASPSTSRLLRRYCEALERTGQAARVPDLLVKALRDSPVFLDDSTLQDQPGWMFAKVVPALIDAGREADALRWAKAHYAFCPFDEAAMQRATKSVVAALAVSDITQKKANAFLAAQGDANRPNPLAEVRLPDVDTEALKALLAQVQGDWRAKDRITLLLLAGDTVAAMLEARRMIVRDPGAPEGVKQASRVFKFVDLNLVRANAFVQYMKAGEGENPMEKFLKEERSRAMLIPPSAVELAQAGEPLRGAAPDPVRPPSLPARPGAELVALVIPPTPRGNGAGPAAVAPSRVPGLVSPAAFEPESAAGAGPQPIAPVSAQQSVALAGKSRLPAQRVAAVAALPADSLVEILQGALYPDVAAAAAEALVSRFPDKAAAAWRSGGDARLRIEDEVIARRDGACLGGAPARASPSGPGQPIAAAAGDGLNAVVGASVDSERLELRQPHPVHNWFAARLTGISPGSELTIRLAMEAGAAKVENWIGLRPLFSYADPTAYESCECFTRDAEGRWISGDPLKSGPARYAGAGKVPEQKALPAALAEEFLSPDGRTWIPWREVEAALANPARSSFVMRQRFQAPQATVAMRVPYTYTYLQAFLERLEARKLPGVSVDVPGETPQGRKLQIVRVGDPAGGPPEARRTVLVTAREHATEHASSWVLHGVLSRLLAEPGLRRGTNWLLIPILDPDGSAESTFSALTDRFCNKKDTPQEVLAYARYLTDYVNAGNSIDLAISLHGVECGEGPNIFCPNVSSPDEAAAVALNTALFAWVRERGFEPGRPAGGSRLSSNFRMFGWCGRRFGALDLAFEVNDRFPGNRLDLARLQAMGAAAADDLAAWLHSPGGEVRHAATAAKLAERAAARKAYFSRPPRDPARRTQYQLITLAY